MDANAPAFPSAGESNGFTFRESGIDIRTYIATKALAAIINAEYGATAQRLRPEQAAEDATTFADALISQLSKP